MGNFYVPGTVLGLGMHDTSANKRDTVAKGKIQNSFSFCHECQLGDVLPKKKKDNECKRKSEGR